MLLLLEVHPAVVPHSLHYSFFEVISLCSAFVCVRDSRNFFFGGTRDYGNFIYLFHTCKGFI